MCKRRRPMDCSLSFLVDHRDLLANCQEISSTGRARKKLLRSCSNPRSAACKSQHSDGEICIIILVAFGSLCLLRLLLISLSRQNEQSFFLKLRLSVGQDNCTDSTSLKFVFTLFLRGLVQKSGTLTIRIDDCRTHSSARGARFFRLPMGVLLTLRVKCSRVRAKSAKVKGSFTNSLLVSFFPPDHC